VEIRSRSAFSLLLLIVLVAGGCSARIGDSGSDIDRATRFDGFPLYWAGQRFEKWELETIDGLGGPAAFVSFIYGRCTPRDGGEPSCAPPVEIQVSPLCSHLDVVAASPIWKRRQIRGAPVGTIDSAPVLFTIGAQVKVYRGEGTDPGVPLRVLRALRSINRVPPLVGSSGRIPAPPRAVLLGARPCRS